ncbi:MAG: hypothetical protein NZ900_02170 [Synergistetes bacterium]|nr:hypothetical protein [Synergistota bacterium]MDW8191735.1 V-type ATPase 116kDa subunit family protein [Synergistota bacterium]
MLAKLCSIEAIELCDIKKTPLYKKGYLITARINEKEEEELASIKRRLLRIFENLDAQPPPLSEEPPNFDGEVLSPEESKLLEEIESQANRIGVTRKVILKSKERIKTYLFKVQNLFGLDVKIEELKNLKYLYYTFGIVPSVQMPRLTRSLESLPHALIPVSGEHLFIFCLRKDKDKVEDILKSVFFEKLELPIKYHGEPERVAKLIELEMERLNIAMRNLNAKAKSFLQEREGLLNALWQRINWRYLSLQIKKLCGSMGSLIALSGWVPEERVKEVERVIDEVCENKVVYEWVDSSKLSGELVPPTFFKNSPLLKPFETLVRLYGTPGHKDIDPTPFIALIYPFFFGFMFGDVGQGIVLYILSSIAKIRFPSLASVAHLAKWCSLSSIAFGILYGHFFGFSDIIKPIILSPMHDIHSMIVSSIAIGIALISLGYIISIVALYKAYGFSKKLFLDKHGVAGLLFFLSFISIFLLWRKIGGLSILFPIPFALMIYLGLRKENPMEGIFSPIIMLIESFSNVISFVRLGAFALNHSLLFMSFFMMGEMLKDSFLGSLGSIIMVVLGNILIIALEGLIVGIQALRLNLYEFFSKFFKGEGKEFKPLSPKNLGFD